MHAFLKLRPGAENHQQKPEKAQKAAAVAITAFLRKNDLAPGADGTATSEEKGGEQDVRAPAFRAQPVKKAPQVNWGIKFLMAKSPDRLIHILNILWGTVANYSQFAPVYRTLIEMLGKKNKDWSKQKHFAMAEIISRKVRSKKTILSFFCRLLKVNDEKSRIRICIRIRRSGSISVALTELSFALSCAQLA
jgi:hypothetical protein